MKSFALALSLLLSLGGCEFTSRTSARPDSGTGPGTSLRPCELAGTCLDAGEPGGSSLELTCTRTVSLGSTFSLSYVVEWLENGGASVTCSVLGGSGPAAGSHTYRYGEAGQPEAACWVDSDVDSPSGGYWRFTMAGDHLTAIATYMDGTSTYGGRQWLISCAGL